MNKSSVGYVSAKRILQALAIYSASLIGCNITCELLGEQIKDQSALERIVREERTKLAIPDSTAITAVRSYVNLTIYYPTSQEFSVLVDTNHTSRLLVKHELHHVKQILAGETHTNIPLVDDMIYFFYEEPRAVVYTATGLDL